MPDSKYLGKDAKKINLGIQLLVFANLFIYIYDGFFGVPYRKELGVFLSLILVVIVFFAFIEDIQWVDLVVPFFFFLILLYARIVTYRGYTSFLKNVPYSFIGFSLVVLIRHGKWPRNSFLLYSLFVCIPFAYSFFYSKIDIVNFADSLNMNRNRIPILLVLTCSILYMVEDSMRKNWLPFFPVLATLVFSFLSLSRTGLAIAIMMVFLIYTINMMNSSRWRIWQQQRFSQMDRKYRIFIMLILYIFLVYISVYLIMNSRFATVGLYTSHRVEIIQEFFSELTVKNVIFGFRPEIVNRIGLHNSYAMALSYLGLGSIFFYGLLIYSVVMFIKHRRFLLLGLLLLQLIYGFSEFLSPLDIGDIVLIPLLSLGLSLGCNGTWLMNRIEAARLRAILSSRRL